MSGLGTSPVSVPRLFGLALAAAIALGLAHFTEWETYISPQWSLAALAASVGLGVLAGVYPAMRAALMDPIVALRAE